MRHSKRDKPKIIVLFIVLAAVWLVIGVRYVTLARHWEAKTAAAHRHQHEAAEATGLPGASAHETAESPKSPLVASLTLRVPPPERDPFYPVVPPRTARGAAAAEPEPPEEGISTAPLATLTLPDWTPGAKDEGLYVAGIIAGAPSIAVLRHGERHYVMKEGDWLDERIRVQAISRSTVTVREGNKSYVLRLGR